MLFIIEHCDIAKNANDNTSYLNGKKANKILSSLENVLSNLFQWFIENELKANTSKCHLLIRSRENKHVNIGTSVMKSY